MREIRQTEDQWFADPVDLLFNAAGEPTYPPHDFVGTNDSHWERNPGLLREIQHRHRIAAHDPRVSSITFFHRELADIAAEEQAAADRERAVHRPTTDELGRFDRVRARLRRRRADVHGRFFGSVNLLVLSTIDTPAKLGYYLRWRAGLPHRLANTPGDRRDGGAVAQVPQVYSVMHRLGIEWAPPPPYPLLSLDEADDECRRIANRLETEDRQWCVSWEAVRAASIQPPAVGAPQADAKPNTESGSRPDRLPPSRRRAYDQYHDAIRRNPDLWGKPDKVVYNWLRDHGDHGDSPLPDDETWARYLRHTRRLLGEQKNTRRDGREAGRSVVNSADI
jgi:hypothetical protein